MSVDDLLCNGDWSRVISQSIGETGFELLASVDAELSQIVDVLFVKRPWAVSLDDETEDHIKRVESKLVSVKSLDKPQVYYYNVLSAEIKTLLGKYDNAIEILKASGLCEDSFTHKYTNILVIRHCSILAFALEATGQPQDALDEYRQGARVVNETVQESPLALIWSERMYYRFCLLAESYAPTESRAVIAGFRGYHAIIRYLDHKNLIQEGVLNRHIQILNAYALYLASSATEHSETETVFETLKRHLFSASKPSSDAVEQFLEAQVGHWRRLHVDTTDTRAVCGIARLKPSQEARIVTDKLLATLQKAMEITFHSCQVMRHMVQVLIACGQYQEARAAFKVYCAYQESAAVRKRASGADPQAAFGDDTRSIAVIFLHMIAVEIYEFQDADRAFDLSHKLATWLEHCPTDHQVGTAVGLGYHYHSQKCLDVNKAQSSLQKALSAYSQAVKFINDVGQARLLDWPTHFLYALLLCESGKVAQAIETLQSSLSHSAQQGTLPHLPSVHLLALALSCQHEYQTAQELLISSMERSDSLTTDLTKSLALEAQLTIVALTEASQNPAMALKEIPQLFALCNRLFDIDKPTKTPQDGLEQQKSRTSAPGTRETEHNPSQTYSSKDKHLASIWLATAGLYRRQDLVEDCRQALEEAKIHGAQESRLAAELGFLERTSAPTVAWTHFERSAVLDDNSVSPLIGMGLLILDNIAKKGCLFLAEEEQDAALSRIQGALESILDRSAAARVPEAFWVLSEFYYRVDNTDLARQALWKSIALEEHRPVRPFACALDKL